VRTSLTTQPTRLPPRLPPPPPQAPSRAPAPPATADGLEPAEPVWRWLLLGVAIAWPATFVLPRMFGWVLAALPHEMGHATFGCLLGRPSAPAISVAGHAWTGIGERRAWLVVAIGLAFAVAAWLQRRRRARCAVLGCAAVLLPLLACSRAAEAAIAAGGHLGELVFATWCFALCTSGGYTGTAQERVASALAGSLLQGLDLRLASGLLTSSEAREAYANNGSLGLKNDLLVLAEDLWHCRLQSVAMLLLLLALLPLPLGAWLGCWRRRRPDGDDGGDGGDGGD
jgi:hypothetical protein